MAEKIPLPWWKESAFRAWMKNTFSTAAVATGAIAVDIAGWKPVLAIAGLSVIKDFLGSAFDIFFGGPDVYMDAPPLPPPQDPPSL